MCVTEEVGELGAKGIVLEAALQIDLPRTSAIESRCSKPSSTFARNLAPRVSLLRAITVKSYVAAHGLDGNVDVLW